MVVWASALSVLDCPKSEKHRLLGVGCAFALIYCGYTYNYPLITIFLYELGHFESWPDFWYGNLPVLGEALRIQSISISTV